MAQTYPNSPLAGQKAIVTGGSRGIGRAIAHTLLHCGVDVAICGRNEDSLRKTIDELSQQVGGVSQGKIVGLACDVTDIHQVRKFFTYADDTLGSLNILVNNAGIGVFRPVAELSPEQWRMTLDTNLTSVFHFCHFAIERFRRGRGGFIVNISSLAGRNAFAGGAAYNASKFGLNGFSEALMLDHRNENVRVCTVMPGSVSTGFAGTHGVADWKIQPEDVAEVVRAVLEMPERTMVSRVEMRPSKPGK
jgi:3-oxoacyl-[acyl-carrier protein] reductase